MKSNQILVSLAIVAAAIIAGYFAVKYVETKAAADDEAREDLKAIEQVKAQNSLASNWNFWRFNNLSRPRPSYMGMNMHGSGFHHHGHTPPPSA